MRTEGQLTRSATEPRLQLSDIQGNILSGFNKDHQRFLFFAIRDPRATKAWLERLGGQIATGSEVFNFNRLYKQMRKRRGTLQTVLETVWVSIAFSFQGLTQLTADVGFDDQAFRMGAHSRSVLLGDPSDPKAKGNFANWKVGSPSCLPDLLLIVAGDRPADVDAQVAAILSGATDALRLLHIDRGEAPSAPKSAFEHFGYRDGISQPGIRGTTPEGEFLTSRLVPGDSSQGRPGQRLVWPGEFVFGYPRQDAANPDRPGPMAVAGPKWATNGSYLVYRRLTQRADVFRRFLLLVATEMSKRPDLVEVTPELLASRLMGRWRSGAPVVLSPFNDDPLLAIDELRENDFDYSPSTSLRPAGQSAEITSDHDFGVASIPLCSHIRLANPRNDRRVLGAESETLTRRLLRRGIPFGNPDSDDEYGLIFLAYQTSIERQFEYVMGSWINGSVGGRSWGEVDPIAGQVSADRERLFRFPWPTKKGKLVDLLVRIPSWVEPTGGAYLFVPSLSGLRTLCDSGVANGRPRN